MLILTSVHGNYPKKTVLKESVSNSVVQKKKKKNYTDIYNVRLV